MPRVGPIFTLEPGYLAVLGATIQPSQHNPVLEDIGQALTDSLPRNGTGPMTGALAMGSFKITGLAAGVAASDAARLDQVGASSAWLTSVSALSLLVDEMVYASGTNIAAKTGLSAFMRTVLDDANAAAALATLGAQPADAQLTDLATPGAIGVIKVSDGTDYDDITPGTDGQVLAGVTGQKPVFSARRVYSSAVTTTGGSTADSTNTFPGGTNIPSWATTVGVELLGVTMVGSGTAPSGFRLGDSSGFLSANYVSHASRDGATDYEPINIFGVQTETGGVSYWGRFILHRLGTGDWTYQGSNAMPDVDGVSEGNGYILSENLGGKTIDRVRFLITGTTFSAMRIVFWYE